MKDIINLNIRIKEDFILLPINDADPISIITFRDETDQSILQFTASITQNTATYWLPIDISNYKGHHITIQIASNNLTPDIKNVIDNTQYLPSNNREEYRPEYHYSAPFGWINDPNGLFYKNGVYHLYFQHNPFGTKWGNMSWGHASSKDLIKWENHPVALLPDEMGEIFSGSIIIDKENNALLGSDMTLAFYTSAKENQVQCLAYSNDNGITFTKFNENPILKDEDKKDFRDPKVFWHNGTKKWIMALATGQSITFYSSSDLKGWERLSEFGKGIGSHKGVWECPDLFELKSGKKKKWVLLVSINPGGPNGGNATQYFLGDFDGHTFTADPLSYPLWLDYGRDNYAGVTWHNCPKNNKTYIGWMSNWDYANDLPTQHFKNVMTLPRTIDIATFNKQLILKTYPIKEVKKLRIEKKDFSTRLLNRMFIIKSFLEDNQGAYEVILEFDIVENTTSSVSITLFNENNEKLNFNLDLRKYLLTTNRSASGITKFNKKFSQGDIIAPLEKTNRYKIKLYIDKCSSELFLNKGKIASTNLIFPSEPYNNIRIDVSDGVIDITKFRIYKLADLNN
ncbi:glycoside hydrolase family 32 protein [Myroides injenensis]|uniref:glycoside hydrolase family 32 protein n=1 Tax=Myroides injenensis TaxID=1183151 RepID=UPI000288B9E0|nr:glycoside hydrolase family 32 protein [Myroides injenensis]